MWGKCGNDFFTMAKNNGSKESNKSSMQKSFKNYKAMYKMKDTAIDVEVQQPERI